MLHLPAGLKLKKCKILSIKTQTNNLHVNVTVCMCVDVPARAKNQQPVFCDSKTLETQNAPQ